MSRLADITHNADRTAPGHGSKATRACRVCCGPALAPFVATRAPVAPWRLPSIGRARCGFAALSVTALLGVTLLCGCRSAAPACQTQPALTVLAAGLDDPDNCCTILTAAACGVRFPTTLAIGELAIGQTLDSAEWTDSGEAAPRETAAPARARAESSTGSRGCAPGEGLVPQTCASLQLAIISPADQGRWVETFRGLNAVCDLRFLSPIDLKSQCGGLPAILAAARRAGAGLLLTYAPNRCGPNSERIAGIVYAVDSGQPLARLQSHMQFLNDEGEECSVDEERGDHREQDAVYQAAREFECRSMACVREIARRTPPVTTIEPNRWVPLYPYCWQPVPRPQPSLSCPQPCPAVAPAAPGTKP